MDAAQVPHDKMKIPANLLSYVNGSPNRPLEHPADDLRGSFSLEPSALASGFKTAAIKAGFAYEEFGQSGDCPLIALTKRTPGIAPRIYLSSGIHGDEPAPPLTLLELIESQAFDDRASWFICPILNPTGLARATRENAAGIDLNRGYLNPVAPEILFHVAWLEKQPDFDLTICLHEDWEAKGFYLYELNPNKRPSLADAMIEAVGSVIRIDTSERIDGREARGGIIRPDPDPALREKWPESIYLRVRHNAGLHYTLETPSGYPLSQRIAAMRTAVRTALDRFEAG
jgi:hypothetical protein